MKLYTDYPIEELGDESYKNAPIREVTLMRIHERYAYVKIEGVNKVVEIKKCYIYQKDKRFKNGLKRYETPIRISNSISSV